MADGEDEAYGSDVTEEYSEDNDKVSYESELKPSDSDIPSTETLRQFSEADIAGLDTYLFDNTTQGFEALANNEMAQGGPQTTSPIIPDSEMNGSAGARAVLKEASPSHYFRPVTPVGHENTMFPSPTGTPGRAVQSPGRGRASVTIFPPPRSSPSGRSAHVTVYPSPSPGSGSQRSSPSPSRTTSPFLSPPARTSPFTSPNRSPRQPSLPSPGRGPAIRGTSTKVGRARGSRGQTPRGGRGRALGSPPSTAGFSSELAEMLKGSKTFDSYKSPPPVVKSPVQTTQQSPISQPRGRGSRSRGQATRGGGRGGRGSTRGQPKQLAAKGAPGGQLGSLKTMHPAPQKPAFSSALASMLQGSSNVLGALQQRPLPVQTPQHQMPEVKSQVSEQLQVALKGSQAMQALSGGGQPVAIVQPRGRSPTEKSENLAMETTNGSCVIKTEQSGKPSNGYPQELTDSEPKAKLPPIDVFLKSNNEVTDFKLPASVAEKAEANDAEDDEGETSGNGKTKSGPASKTSTRKNSNKRPARKGTKRKKDDKDLDDDDDEEYYGSDEEDEDDDDYVPEEKDQMAEKDQVPKKPPARKRTKRVKDDNAEYLPHGRAATRGNGKVVTAEVHKEQGLFSDGEMASTESGKPDKRAKNTKPKPGPRSRKANTQSKTKKSTGEVQMDDGSEENIRDNVQEDIEQSKTEPAEQPLKRKHSPKQKEMRDDEVSEAENDDEQVEDQSRLDGDAAESQESETSKSPAGKKKTTSKKTPAKAKKNTPAANKKAAKDAQKKLESTMKDFEVRIPVFKCYNCDETFASKGELAKHDAEYHPQMLECKKCQAVFVDKEAFLKHAAECEVNPVEDEREMEESEKPSNFVCEECEEEFEDRIELERHMMTHGDEAGFACTACLQKFATEEEKEQHVNEDHQDETSFACTACVQRFATEEEKEQHMYQYHNADE